MAVSQVDRLKNPCRVTTWNNFVASQPPSSAPTMPITHVMMRPCCLLPGISMLASRPAPRPRMIHAMMPITGLLYCDEADGRPGAGSQPGGLAPPCFAIPRRRTCHTQSSGDLRRRKGQETANAITQADYQRAARTLISTDRGFFRKNRTCYNFAAMPGDKGDEQRCRSSTCHRNGST